MKFKQLIFFASRDDLIFLMDKIQKQYFIEFVEMGNFQTERIIKYDNLNTIPNLGYTNYPNWISSDNRFMIIKYGAEIKVRNINLIKGGVSYAIDQYFNPDSVELCTGGIYIKKENVLLAGRLSVIQEKSFSFELFKSISTVIRKDFKKLHNTFVGEEAFEKLMAGWRLTQIANSSTEYDLRL